MSMSSRSGSTSKRTSLPASAISAVRAVRGKRVCTHTSTAMFASMAPSSLASWRPRSVRGTSRVGSPLMRRSRFRIDSAWRQKMKRRISRPSDDELLLAGLTAGEPLRRERRQVQRGHDPDDPLSEELAHGRALLKPMAGETRGIEEARGLLCLADEGVPIRAHLVVPPPGRLDGQLREHGQAPRRVCGHALDGRLTAAEDEAWAFAVEVEAAREVDRERKLLGQAARLRRVVHPAGLADDWQVDPDQGSDLARPDARRADDHFRLDAPLGRLDAEDLVA